MQLSRKRNHNEKEKFIYSSGTAFMYCIAYDNACAGPD